MKAKIKCVAVLSKALTPFAVIVARFKFHTYVFLDYEDRVDLQQLWRSQGEDAPYVSHVQRADFPQLVRGHAIDVETGVATELRTRRGDWMNAEGLWVRSDVAERAVAALVRYRLDNDATDSIGAPNWRCLTAIRALALAHGLPDPGINSEPARSRAVSP